MASFAPHFFTRTVYVVYNWDLSFLWLHSIPLSGYTIMSMRISVKTAAISIHVHLKNKHKYAFMLDKYLIMEFLGYMVSNSFPKCLYKFIVLTSSVQYFQLFITWLKFSIIFLLKLINFVCYVVVLHFGFNLHFFYD